MDRDEKINFINAYEKLLNHKLPVKSDSEDFKDAVQKEFRDWVESRLDVLLGNKAADAPTVAPAPALPFTEEEIQTLKEIAAAGAPTLPYAPEDFAPPEPLERPRPQRRAPRRQNTDELPIAAGLNKQVVEALGLAEDLEQMNAEYPEWLK